MKGVPYLLLGVLCLWYLPSCEYIDMGLNDKKDYIKDYHALLEKVEDGHTSYEEHDWQQLDKEFMKFSHDHYRYFEKELNFREKLEVGKYPIMYYLYRYKGMVRRHINNNFKPDAEALINSLSEIMDTTANVYYNGFDKEIKDMLRHFDEKSTIKNQTKKPKYNPPKLKPKPNTSPLKPIKKPKETPTPTNESPYGYE